MNGSTVLRRRAGLLCLAVAPVLLLVATAVDPALGEGAWETHVGADPEGAVWHTVLLHWAYVLFVPGFLSLLGPIHARGRVLGAIAWVATLVGLVTFAGLVLTDVTAIAVAETVEPATFTAFEERVSTYTWMSAGWQLPGLVGWFVAFALTPVAAARAKVIGWWPAGAALAGFALYFLFAIEPVPLSLAGPAVLTAANIVIVAKAWGTVGGGAESTWKQKVGEACLVAAPVALAVGVATMPGTATRIDPFSTDPQLAQASAFFLHLSWLLFIPGMLAVVRRITGRGRVFAFVAGGIAVVGLLHWNGLMIGDYLALGVQQTLDPAQQAMVTTRTDGYAMFGLAVAIPGMAGALLGLILVPVAASRAGLVRWYVPVITGVGVVAFLMLTTGRVTGLVAPVLLLIGYGLVARALRSGQDQAPVAAAPVVVPAT
ncbi:hypothetical protein Ais01nite_02220 [Asanoa ishikariensis]|uniref:Uncharacterized protein n=1 Tax=Asanoa ishikariensis TaxID=137265 RepID=A0A1H3TLA3_9ACTN|nr:hypothetical protein [Asanoa ishikariensis]GIF62187.1 hypothetical protein Ais01nite_02220 [Asanoa ishikariensis]SDZ51006.1 hypothetical protein SAMN05421684_6003 [Asanoa ishikariensis]